MKQNLKNTLNLNFVIEIILKIKNIKSLKIFFVGIILIILLLIGIKIFYVINELYFYKLFFILKSIYLDREILFDNIYHNISFLTELIYLKLTVNLKKRIND